MRREHHCIFRGEFHKLVPEKLSLMVFLCTHCSYLFFWMRSKILKPFKRARIIIFPLVQFTCTKNSWTNNLRQLIHFWWKLIFNLSSKFIASINWLLSTSFHIPNIFYFLDEIRIRFRIDLDILILFVNHNIILALVWLQQLLCLQILIIRQDRLFIGEILLSVSLLSISLELIERITGSYAQYILRCTRWII